MKSHQKWIWQLPDWPALRFEAHQIQATLSAARHAQGVLVGKAQVIGLEGLQPHVVDALTQEALTTSAIEGEKLDAASVRSSIAKRLGLDNHGAPPAEGKRHIEGLIDILQDATLHTAELLTLERICQWHGALFPTGFSGMHRIDVGALRTTSMEIVSGSVGHVKVHYQAPPAIALEAQMDAFIVWFNASNPKTGTQAMDGLIRAALAHVWFETLHPFDDGNGRIGRAILQLALGQDMGASGRIISVSRQIESCKLAYYRQLEAAQRSQTLDVSGWVNWMLAQIAVSADHAARMIDSSLERINFQSSMSKAPLNDRQRKSMEKLLDAGPQGYVGGMTTRKHKAISQVSTPTAARDLIELEQLGLLVRQGAGRSVRYYPAIAGWAEPLSAIAEAS